MKPARIVLLVLGSLMALVGFGLVAGGGALGWALATQRDDNGFFTTSDQRFQTDTFALTSDRIDLGRPGPDDWWADRHLATVRVRVDGAGSGPVFVGGQLVRGHGAIQSAGPITREPARSRRAARAVAICSACC